MSTNKERIENLEAGLGELQQGVSRLELKLHHMEETLARRCYPIKKDPTTTIMIVIVICTTTEPSSKIMWRGNVRWLVYGTMQVIARIGHYEMVVLIDSGSTQNFISERMTNLLQLLVMPTKPFSVKVANGKPLQRQGIQGILFILTLYTIPLIELDLVLGVHWQLKDNLNVARNIMNVDVLVTIELPPVATDGDIVVEPEAILDARWIKRGTRLVQESLINWKRLPIEDATWDLSQEVQDRFMNLKDKVSVQ
ncbi:hypothetical protein RJ641_023380 [Dillenia turbinata]|uniref:Uncharacterized protein n=1 Tax=Dillenia turbinata TaxID=194707 RepID=A0AAN8UIV7_9MAGN